MNDFFGLQDKTQENFVMCCLDGSHKIAGIFNIFQGTVNRCLVSNRDIFQRAFLCNAVSIILAHNHPSGNINPSEEDEILCEKIKAGCDAVGIKLLDNFIIGDGEYFSFAENHLI